MITQVLEPVLLSHLYHSCAPKSVTKAFWLFICTAHKAFPNEILLSMKDPTLPPPKTTALSLVSVAVGPFLECLGKERSSQRGRGIYLCISPWQLAGEQNKTRSIQIYFPVQIFIFIFFLYVPLYCKWERLLKDIWVFKHFCSSLQTRCVLLTWVPQKQYCYQLNTARVWHLMYLIYIGTATMKETRHLKNWLFDGNAAVQIRAIQHDFSYNL